MGDELLPKHSPDKNQRLITINDIYHIQNNFRNSLDKLKHFSLDKPRFYPWFVRIPCYLDHLSVCPALFQQFSEWHYQWIHPLHIYTKTQINLISISSENSIWAIIFKTFIKIYRPQKYDTSSLTGEAAERILCLQNPPLSLALYHWHKGLFGKNSWN